MKKREDLCFAARKIGEGEGGYILQLHTAKKILNKNETMNSRMD